MTGIGLTFDQTSSGTGPRDFQVSYSTDGSLFTDVGSLYSLPNFGFSTRETNTFTYDLSTLTTNAVNNQASLFLRLTNANTNAVGGGTVAAAGTGRIDNVKVVSNYANPIPAAAALQGGDLVMGLNTNGTSMEVVRGAASLNGGARAGDPFQGDPFIEYVKFDNTGGKLHNVKGNVLAVNFAVGGGANSGAIFSYGSQGSLPLPAPEPIGNTGATPSGGQKGQNGPYGTLPQTPLSSLSINPSNNRIAVSGSGNAASPGSVFIYDYTPGNTMGSGAALNNGRASSNPARILTPTLSQGTVWVNDNTVLALNANGGLWTVDGAYVPTGVGDPAPATFLHALPVDFGPQTTALAYNSQVSPYVFALWGGFTSPTSKGRLYVLDPANGFHTVGFDGSTEVFADLSTALGADTPRDIAIDAAGNLFISGFSSTINVIPNAAAHAADAATYMPANLVDWYQSAFTASFNGFDIGLSPSLAGDYNANGVVDTADYILWRNDPASFGGAGGYNTWAANFGSDWGQRQRDRNGQCAGASWLDPARRWTSGRRLPALNTRLNTTELAS